MCSAPPGALWAVHGERSDGVDNALARVMDDLRIGDAGETQGNGIILRLHRFNGTLDDDDVGLDFLPSLRNVAPECGPRNVWYTSRLAVEPAGDGRFRALASVGGAVENGILTLETENAGDLPFRRLRATLSVDLSVTGLWTLAGRAEGVIPIDVALRTAAFVGCIPDGYAFYVGDGTTLGLKEAICRNRDWDLDQDGACDALTSQFDVFMREVTFGGIMVAEASCETGIDPDNQSCETG